MVSSVTPRLERLLALGKMLELSWPQFPHLRSEGNKTAIIVVQTQ